MDAKHAISIRPWHGKTPECKHTMLLLRSENDLTNLSSATVQSVAGVLSCAFVGSATY